MYQVSFDDERGVSPVIGVILMVAITVLLAATAATFFLGFQDGTGSVTPSAAFDVDYDADTGAASDTITVSHNSGDSIAAGDLAIVVSDATASSGDPNGRYAWEALAGGAIGASSKVTAGEQVTLSPSTMTGVSGSIDFSEATVTIVWTAGAGDTSTTLQEWTK